MIYAVFVQAVTKYIVEARSADSNSCPAAGALHEVNIRDAFVAGPGCILLAADYSQVELRVLAHLSGDSKLIQVLRQAGSSGDAFALIAKTWLRKPHEAGTRAFLDCQQLRFRSQLKCFDKEESGPGEGAKAGAGEGTCAHIATVQYSAQMQLGCLAVPSLAKCATYKYHDVFRGNFARGSCYDCPTALSNFHLQVQLWVQRSVPKPKLWRMALSTA